MLRTPWLLLRTFRFGTLPLPRVVSMTDPPNPRSLAVMRTLGIWLS